MEKTAFSVKLRIFLAFVLWAGDLQIRVGREMTLNKML
jgi:hypothetical protein